MFWKGVVVKLWPLIPPNLHSQKQENVSNLSQKQTFTGAAENAFSHKVDTYL